MAMEAGNLYSYLEKNVDMGGSAPFIKKALMDVSSKSWIKGYMACVRHNKKRRILQLKRARSVVNAFLDHLHEITHKS
jgi:hypothetical protein